MVSTLEDAFAPLVEADPAAFRGKFRTMASDPHAFYRGSACLFYADVTGAQDPFVDDESSRIWVHGDLHVENFGTYLNSDGLPGLRRQRLRRGLPRSLHLGPAAVRRVARAGRVAEGAARRRTYAG